MCVISSQLFRALPGHAVDNLERFLLKLLWNLLYCKILQMCFSKYSLTFQLKLMVWVVQLHRRLNSRDPEDHSQHKLISISQKCSILFESAHVTVFARCLNTFCKTSLIVLKLYTQVNMTQHWQIYHSHLCQIKTLLSKPNNPLSNCNSDDKITHSCIMCIQFQIRGNTPVYFR